MNVVLFYVPSLHRCLSPVLLPENIVFFPTGMQTDEVTAARQAPAPESARHAHADAEALLPLGAEQAASVLAQALQVGEVYGLGGVLRQLAAARLAAERQGGRAGEPARRLRPDELDALAMFSVSGCAAKAAPDASSLTGEKGDPQRDALISCQNVLLLMHALEEQVLDSRRLQERCLHAENALQAALGEGGDGENPALTGGEKEGEGAGELAVDIPWTVAADAALAFLPEKALVFSAHDTMVADICAAEAVQPLAECRAELTPLWPDEQRAGLMYARLPAWRLAGRKSAPPERPWLARHIEVVLLQRPKSSQRL